MPVTIRNGQVKIKGTNGYVSVDTLADSTTASRIAAINAVGAEALGNIQDEGAAQVAAIEQKGEDVLADIPADYTELSDAVSELNSALTLLEDVIPDTVQTIVFDSSGNVQRITHVRNSAAVRTDVFTFAASTITEVRTLATGESLTIVTNTDTLETTTTYADAA